ncbi:hypothetical protein AA309_22740 [Microvirga vignae]|uniref:Uncharacterized protein n=1 Tax=Microvirga vignae TaxID=1225564 RepID=A0A0H1R772_9HYPH|nr:hypothetical protein [Microvirga vignae]KLK90998.1 hypothetical protein AA309_22740 [Microvirga vignae]
MMSYYDDDEDYVDYEAYVDYGDYASRDSYRNKLPYSYLTEKDLEELLTLDLDLAEEFSWIWSRAINNMCREFERKLKTVEAVRLALTHPYKSYLEWWETEQKIKSKNRKARRDAARNEAKKEAKRAERETEEYKALDAIKRESVLRLRLLRAGTKKPRGDKCVEQLPGNEEIYVKAWKARQLAHRKYGPKASPAKIAQVYNESYPRESVTRHQIRAWSKVILHLEKPGGIWDPDKLTRRLDRGKTA